MDESWVLISSKLWVLLLVFLLENGGLKWGKKWDSHLPPWVDDSRSGAPQNLSEHGASLCHGKWSFFMGSMMKSYEEPDDSMMKSYEQRWDFAGALSIKPQVAL